ncbi:MAG TPA: gfo/Idh/MocA family oxidoreductase [Candidatus Latescibacteria bacterium]|nr:dehydrogenase [Gemmatimonadota bacterium]HCR17289.1 gfo/Idh/MocA family oxidoreductase [Candidatus Latescibacterota bacterium]|tara:strand:+ start:99 stop:1142 length:1044 start_codon:yes stop_codon:yes gene_type:complete
MADKVRIGIIGAGDIFRSRHFPGLAKVDEAEVVAICNRSKESGQAIAGEFGLSPDIMTDPDALLAREDVDAVMIGTWPYKHCPFVLDSLDAGKHTFVQARMAMNLAEAKSMYANAKEKGLVTQICPSPMAMKGDWFVQRLIREGYLGDIYQVYTRSFNGSSCDPSVPLHWRQIGRYSGLNALNMGILVEIVQRWAGCMKTVAAQAATFIKERQLEGEEGTGPVERPDAVHIMGEMQNGAQAAFLFSSVARFGVSPQVELYGSEGTLIYKLDSDEILGAKAGDSGLAKLQIPADEVREWTVEADFVNAINGGPQGDTSFEAGVNYMEFTEAVFRSVERNATVNLPLVD